MIKKTRFFTVVFVVVLLVIYSFLSAQTAPDWLDRIQVFQMSKGYFFNPSPNLSKVLFTGHGWGIYFPNLLVDYSIQNEIDAWHNNNGPYMTWEPRRSFSWTPRSKSKCLCRTACRT